VLVYGEINDCFKPLWLSESLKVAPRIASRELCKITELSGGC